MDSVLDEAADGGTGDRQGARRARSLSSHPALADLAAELLRTEGAFTGLQEADAVCVVAYMGLVSYPAGATVFRAGDASRTGYLLLILDGEVSVDSVDPMGGSSLTMSVLGPGSVIGEMGLLDGAPRSTTCMAACALQAAGLTRTALQRLIDDHPDVGARLLVGLCKRLADRLRGLDHQLHLYAELNASLQQQLQAMSARSRS